MHDEREYGRHFRALATAEGSTRHVHFWETPRVPGLLTTQAKALDDPLPCRRENPQLWFSDLPADLQLAKA